MLGKEDCYPNKGCFHRNQRVTTATEGLLVPLNNSCFNKHKIQSCISGNLSLWLALQKHNIDVVELFLKRIGVGILVLRSSSSKSNSNTSRVATSRCTY